ncbi:type IV pilus modification PilV family protein [Bacillus piscicola]|uniref:type IV pilus modification PilV family protein n=1 Tax=Bacillus piscicola TaxID=1632684 RepID=UPI001F0976DE
MAHQTDGFTLIELLTSITILAIVLLVFFGFFGQGLSFSTTTSHKQTAVHLAKETLQAVKESDDKNKIPDSFYSGDEPLESKNYPTNFFSPDCPGCIELNGETFYPAVSPDRSLSEEYGLFPVKVVIYNDPSHKKVLTFTYGYLKGGS